MKKIFLTTVVLLATTFMAVAADYSCYYKDLPVNIPQVKQPVLKEAQINIKDYGAVGDGKTDCTKILQNAIDDLSAKGGGQVNVPAGSWLVSPIALKSGINLHLEKGAMIILTPDRTKHMKVGATKPMNGISALGCKNVAITGEGIINGNGIYWRAAKHSKYSDTEWDQLKSLGGITASKGNDEIWYPYNLKNLPNLAESVAKQESLRQSVVFFKGCEGAFISGVTIIDSPKFHLELEDCSNLIVDGVHINCAWNAQNGDGIVLKTSQNVLIVNNTIDCGNDAISLKAATGKRAFDHKPMKDVVIANNTVVYAHGGFVIGSEFASGISDVCVYNNVLANTETGLRFKSYTSRGGKTDNIYIWNILMDKVKDEAIGFQTDYINEAIYKTEGSTGTDWIPEFQGIHISNVTCNKARIGISANGARGTVHDIDISDCNIAYSETNTDIDPNCEINVKNVTLRKF
ncbi:MAG: right-handed parallel beta-helix repeat-containing protein [Prevotella sp.]|nr:right-handed parallel beta-helix repeat-containing protein [Prevotella sp.]